MNLVGAITVDFISQLREQTTGWSITPIVTAYEYMVGHGGLLPYLPCPQGVSPLDHYHSHPPTHDNSFIQIKAPKRPLRLIRLSLKPPLLKGGWGWSRHSPRVENNPTRPVAFLSYWRANGWVRHDEGTHARFRPKYHKQGEDFPPEGYRTLLIYQIHRISKPRRKGRAVVHQDYFEFSNPEQDQAVIQTVAQTIAKSWEWQHRRHKGQAGNIYEEFSPSEPCLMVDLNRGNYECEEHFVP
jgi:hypothetical protein